MEQQTPAFTRLAMVCAYDGTSFAGWQVQPNAISIQSVIEEALETILRQKMAIVASGRTDAGVHASYQPFHCEVGSGKEELLILHDLNQLQYRLNQLLPPQIAILKSAWVSADFHARFSAIDRTYHYDLHQIKNPFLGKFSTFNSRPLDFELMNQAALYLVGEHDFTTFSKISADVLHHRCTITSAKWTQGEGEYGSWRFTITANRFLRGMVRALVGALLEVGYGKKSLSEFQLALAGQDRALAASLAPPQGLALAHVRYPDYLFATNVQF